MKNLENVDLYKYNTMRLHSFADMMYCPESIDELIDLIKEFKSANQKYYILAGGSNIVFRSRITTPLVYMMNVYDTLEVGSNNTIVCGASVRIQKLINFAKERGFGGIEYLYSVPSSVGGAVLMNAGRGKDQGLAISDYISTITYLDCDDLQVKEYKVDKCDFTYRNSPFKHTNKIVLSASFCFKEQTKEQTEEKIKERLDYSKKYLSADKPNCGSVFKQINPIIMRLLRGQRIGGAMYSKKTSNWISNINNASADDIIGLVNLAKKIHKIFLQKCECEIIIME